MYLGIYLPYMTLAQAFIEALKKDNPENETILEYEKALTSLYDEKYEWTIKNMNCQMEEMFGGIGAFYDGSTNTPYVLFLDKRMRCKTIIPNTVYKHEIPNRTDVEELLAAYEKSPVRKMFGKMTEGDVGLFDEQFPS